MPDKNVLACDGVWRHDASVCMIAGATLGCIALLAHRRPDRGACLPTALLVACALYAIGAVSLHGLDTIAADSGCIDPCAFTLMAATALALQWLMTRLVGRAPVRSVVDGLANHAFGIIITLLHGALVLACIAGTNNPAALHATRDALRGVALADVTGAVAFVFVDAVAWMCSPRADSGAVHAPVKCGCCVNGYGF